MIRTNFRLVSLPQLLMSLFRKGNNITFDNSEIQGLTLYDGKLYFSFSLNVISKYASVRTNSATYSTYSSQSAPSANYTPVLECLLKIYRNFDATNWDSFGFYGADIIASSNGDWSAVSLLNEEEFSLYNSLNESPASVSHIASSIRLDVEKCGQIVTYLYHLGLLDISPPSAETSLLC